MSEPIKITPFYPGWEDFQKLLVQTITPLSQEQLELKAADHQWPVGMLVAHIISCRSGWFHYWLKCGGEELESLLDWDEEPIRSAQELVEGLEMTWKMVKDGLNQWTSEDLNDIFIDPFHTEEPRRQRSRAWIIWHVLEHDIFHGGEVSQILGTYGIRGIDL